MAGWQIRANQNGVAVRLAHIVESAGLQIHHRHFHVPFLRCGRHGVVGAARGQRLHEDLEIVVHHVGGRTGAAGHEIARRLIAQERGFLHRNQVRLAGGDFIGHRRDADRRLRGKDFVIDAGHRAHQLGEVVRVGWIECQYPTSAGADVEVGVHRLYAAFATELGRSGLRGCNRCDEREDQHPLSCRPYWPDLCAPVGSRGAMVRGFISARGFHSFPIVCQGGNCCRPSWPHLSARANLTGFPAGAPELHHSSVRHRPAFPFMESSPRISRNNQARA